MRIRLVFWTYTISLVLLLLGASLLTALAYPVSFTWRTADSQGSTAFGVYDSDDTTVLSGGDLAQLIWAGPDGLIDPPKYDGSPSGDDRVLTEAAVTNVGSLPPPMQYKGYILPKDPYSFDTETSPALGGVVYIRAWNAGVAGAPALYGDSITSILTPGATFNARRWHTAGDPLAVQLASFSASPTGGQIVITWETVSEQDVAGFHLYRSDSEQGPWERINSQIIVSQAGGSSQGAPYRWEDKTAAAGRTYFYRLDQVALDGTSTSLGVTEIDFTPVRLWLPQISW